VTYRLLFILVLLAHDRRRVRHIAVTAHPTAAWMAQQLREAFPWDEAPRYLLHDRDHAFDCLGDTAKSMRIEELLTAPRAPWQNAFVERFIGSARRVHGVNYSRRLTTTISAGEGQQRSVAHHLAALGCCRRPVGGRRGRQRRSAVRRAGASRDPWNAGTRITRSVRRRPAHGVASAA
jgi:hypothetical protein